MDVRCRSAEVAGMRNLIALLLFSIASSAAITASAADQVVLPIQRQHVSGMLIVEAVVNGHPVHLIVDTGATVTLLSREALNAAAPGGSGFLSAGFLARARGIEVDLRLDSRRWPRRLVGVADLSQIREVLGANIDGLLGEDVLSEFTSMQIDYKARTLTLTRE
jgi:hypothetical protein